MVKSYMRMFRDVYHRLSRIFDPRGIHSREIATLMNKANQLKDDIQDHWYGNNEDLEASRLTGPKLKRVTFDTQQAQITDATEMYRR